MIFELKKRDTYSNVIGPAELEKETSKTLRFESKVFSRTLGPYGKNTIIEDHTLHHVTTKDGNTVYQSLYFYPRLARTSARLFQKISGSLNEVVGDGTTSSIVIANELYRLRKLIKKYHVTPRFLTESVKLVSGILNDNVKENALQLITIHNNIVEKSDIFDEYIKAVASISLNNDWKSGALVAEMFGKLRDPRHGFINVEISRTNETHYDLERGFEIVRGLIMPEMVTEPDRKRAIYLEPLVCVIKGNLMTTDAESLKFIVNHVIGTLGRPLVIISGGFSQAIRETFRQSLIAYAEKYNSRMKLVCIEVDTESTIGKENLEDLAMNIGARIITVDSVKPFPQEQNPVEYEKYLGTCEKIIASTTSYTRFIRGKGDPDRINFRVADIDKEIDAMKSEQHIDNGYNIFLLQRRKAALLGDMVTLSVGADTLEEKENRQHLFDDAVRGCKSAIRSGVVFGGNTIIPKICHKILSDEYACRSIAKTIRDELEEVIPENIYSEKVFLKFIKHIIREIEIAYTRTFAIIINNRFNNWNKSLKKAKENVSKYALYDLITGIDAKTPVSLCLSLENPSAKHIKTAYFDTKILNSAEVDTQILTAAVSIIDLVIASNQYLRIPSREEMIKNM
jgi:chaperonin GroEL